MYYFTADWHFNHTNILTYTQRPYPDVKRMNNDIVKLHNELVKPEDTVFVLGDVAMSKKAKSAKYVQKMNGRKILILGNHDTSVSNERWINEFGFDEVYSYYIAHIEGVYIVMAHDPVESLFLARNIGFDNPPLILNGHIHNLAEFTEDEITSNLSLNVGVDVNDMKPFTLEQLLMREFQLKEGFNA